MTEAAREEHVKYEKSKCSDHYEDRDAYMIMEKQSHRVIYSICHCLFVWWNDGYGRRMVTYGIILLRNVIYEGEYSMKDSIQLSKAERKVAEKIWEKGGMVTVPTVPEVVSMLCEEEKWAYQTVATFLKRLEDKQMLVSKKQGRNLCYFPLISKEQYKSMEAQDFVKSKFDGSLKKFLNAVFGNEYLYKKNIKELQEWLDEMSSE